MLSYTREQISLLDPYYKHPKNLVDLFEDSAARWPERNAIGTKNPQTGQFDWITYQQLAARIDHTRAALHQMGLKQGDALGVIVGNSVEWCILENASHGLGAVFVPMYEKELERTWQYIITDSAMKFLFVRNAAIYDKVKKYKDTISTLQDIIIIEGAGTHTLADLEELGQKHPHASLKPAWYDPADLIYTSGTTGEPKGVLLSHGNLTTCAQTGHKFFSDLNETSVSLSILPWAHSYGLTAELHVFLLIGGAIAIMESIETLAGDIQLARPTYLIAVPKVFNRIYDGIQMTMHEKGGIPRMLFNLAVSRAQKERGRTRKSLFLKILDRLVFSRLRARFGGRLSGVLTASAVMNPKIAMFFADIGVPTYDAYGLTEAAPAISLNSPAYGNKYGSVGKVMDNMHVVIDKSRSDDLSDEGEILAYGAHIMMGYHNKPEQTAQMMTKDTWMSFPGIHTGDRGRLDGDGFLFITGRFKDEYKLENGKYVHPESIETDIKLVHNVSNAFVWGDNKAYNVAVIVPDIATLKRDERVAKWVKGTPDEIVQNPKIQEFLIKQITRRLKKSYGGYEIPQKFLFTAGDFTLENGLLTQTMKLKRSKAIEVFREEIEKLYEQQE